MYKHEQVLVSKFLEFRKRIAMFHACAGFVVKLCIVSLKVASVVAVENDWNSGVDDGSPILLIKSLKVP